jgi:cysteine sulfinate desulfinase/cysteine desulfurase-like protein
MALKEVALSSGSACTSASLEPSYVLRALGAAEDMAHSSLRFGIGRFTTEAEIDFVTQKLVNTVTRLREMRFVSRQLALELSLKHFLAQPSLGNGSGRYRHQVY